MIDDNPQEDSEEGSGQNSAESGRVGEEEGEGDGEKKRKRKRRGQYIYIYIHIYSDVCSCSDCTAVDDQLDEDDLELIKENTGFDIQAVSSLPVMFTCMYTHLYNTHTHTHICTVYIVHVQFCFVVCVCVCVCVCACRKNNVELVLRVMMRRKMREMLEEGIELMKIGQL